MSHPKNAGYEPGNHWLVCDVCGMDVRYKDARKRWDNLWVCHADWEPRQPQDFLRAVKDDMRVPVVRSPGEPEFLAKGQVTQESL